MTELKLDRSQIDLFLAEGYLVLDSITTREEVGWLRQLYDQIFEAGIGWEKGQMIDLAVNSRQPGAAALPQMLMPSKTFPELKHTIFRANAQSIARQILGPNAESEPRNEHMIYKPPGRGAATPWHQDQAYADPAFRYTNINFWMPLDDAVPENGCMKYVPRSHTMDVEVLPHQPIGGDAAVDGLEALDQQACESKSVSAPVPAGGACLHHSYLLHAAGANTSARPRRAYILVFGLPAEQRPAPLDFPWRANRLATAGSRRRATATSP